MANYTDKELMELNKLKDNLIIWMYHNTNDSHPILHTIKQAYELGKKQGKSSPQKERKR